MVFVQPQTPGRNVRKRDTCVCSSVHSTNVKLFLWVSNSVVLVLKIKGGNTSGIPHSKGQILLFKGSCVMKLDFPWAPQSHHLQCSMSWLSSFSWTSVCWSNLLHPGSCAFSVDSATPHVHRGCNQPAMNSK